MKKKWVAPRVEVQKFEANEYVAACWGVGCDTDAANWWEVEHKYYFTFHLKGHCGNVDHQVLRDTNGDGRVDEMVETKEGGLTCTIYPNDSYNPGEIMSPGDVQVEPGKTIYWTTNLDNKTYHHQGQIIMADPSRPNHS